MEVLTVSTACPLSPFLYLFLPRALSPLLLSPPSALPHFSPQSPFPLFSSCCVILILHTLLLWTMNNAWCVRNPQCHAWVPASIAGLASLLPEMNRIETGISRRTRSNIFCFVALRHQFRPSLSVYKWCIQTEGIINGYNICQTFIILCIGNAASFFSAFRIQINLKSERKFSFRWDFEMYAVVCCWHWKKKNHFQVLISLRATWKFNYTKMQNHKLPSFCFDLMEMTRLRLQGQHIYKPTGGLRACVRAHRPLPVFVLAACTCTGSWGAAKCKQKPVCQPLFPSKEITTFHRSVFEFLFLLLLTEL